MAIKNSLGKLNLAKPLRGLLPPLLADAGIELLQIEIPDLARVATLPFHHRDPFELRSGNCNTAISYEGSPKHSPE